MGCGSSMWRDVLNRCDSEWHFRGFSSLRSFLRCGSYMVWLLGYVGCEGLCI